MKKLFMILLAALFVFCSAHAEPVSEESFALEGMVLEITEEGWLIENAELGEVMILTSEDTYVEAMRDIIPSDYLYIDYNGMMTRSLPPQVTASVVRMYVLTGSVVEANAEENTLLLNTDTHGEVMVNLPEEWAGYEIDSEYMTVYFNGAMTMSIPAQIGAGHALPGYTLQGTVTEINDDWMLIGEGMEAVQVHYAAPLMPENVKVGDVILVIHDGQMTRSIPAQISASQIIQVSR